MRISEDEAILFFKGEKKTVSLTQKYWKIHAKSVKRSVAHLCFLLRISRFNKNINQKRMFMTCFYHIEGHFKAAYVLM